MNRYSTASGLTTSWRSLAIGEVPGLASRHIWTKVDVEIRPGQSAWSACCRSLLGLEYHCTVPRPECPACTACTDASPRERSSTRARPIAAKASEKEQFKPQSRDGEVDPVKDSVSQKFLGGPIRRFRHEGNRKRERQHGSEEEAEASARSQPPEEGQHHCERHRPRG